MTASVVVCAYHEVGFRCLEELLSHGADVRLVFSHEDAPGEAIAFGSVRALAAQHGIRCITSDIHLPENVVLLRAVAPDFLLSFYFRTVLQPTILGLALRGALNVHGSHLPAYRGRAPTNWAVLNGDTATGVTLHYMIAKPDAGDIVDQQQVPILFTDTALDVLHKVADAGVLVLRRSWPLLLAGTAPRTPMDLRQGTEFRGRTPADGAIDWSQSAIRIYNLIRAVTHPYPGAFAWLAGTKVLIWQAWPVTGRGEPGRILSLDPLWVGTGDGLLQIHRLQIAGETEESAADFAVRHLAADRQFDVVSEP